MPRTAPKPPIIRGLARDCTCTPPQPHGTHHGYEYHSCGCDACRAAGTRYVKVSRYLSTNGLTRRRAAEPIRRRIRLLKERGLTVRAIADLSGVSFTNLHLVLRSDQPTVTERVADAVMSVRVPPRTRRAS